MAGSGARIRARRALRQERAADDTTSGDTNPPGQLAGRGLATPATVRLATQPTPGRGTLTREALLAHGRRSRQRLRTLGSAGRVSDAADPAAHTARAAAPTDGLVAAALADEAFGHGVGARAHPAPAAAPSGGVDAERSAAKGLAKAHVLHERLQMLTARNDELEFEATRLRRERDAAEAQPELVATLREVLGALTLEHEAIVSKLQMALADNDELIEAQIEAHATAAAELEVTRGALRTASEQLASARAELSSLRAAKNGGLAHYSAGNAVSLPVLAAEPSTFPSPRPSILQRWGSFTGDTEGASPGTESSAPEGEGLAEGGYAGPHEGLAEGRVAPMQGGAGDAAATPVRPTLPSGGLTVRVGSGAGTRQAEESGAGVVLSIIEARMAAAAREEQAEEQAQLPGHDSSPGHAQTPPTMIRFTSPRAPAADEAGVAGSGTPLFHDSVIAHTSLHHARPPDSLSGLEAPPSAADPAGASDAPPASSGQARAAEATDIARLEQLIQAIMTNERLAVAESGSVSRAAREARAQLQLVGTGWAAVDLGQPLLPPRVRPGFFARLFGFGDEVVELGWADDRPAAVNV
jgi:hypothetical protein